MAKSRSMPTGLLQRLQQSTAARPRNVSPKLTAESVSLDLRSLAEPDRIYYAREAWIEYKNSVVSFYFAQRRRDDNKLRSLICVNMGPDHAASLLKSVEGIKSPSLADIASTVG